MRFYSIFLATLLAILVSCSKSNSNSNKDLLIGTWTCTNFENDGVLDSSEIGLKLIFKPCDTTCQGSVFIPDSQKNLPFSYIVSEDEKSLIYDNYTSIQEITELTSNKLVLTTRFGTLILKRTYVK